jgi:SNF2 family DNA or RNA helicase
MNYKIKPWAHQQKAIDICKHRNNYALFWEMGTGKTGAMINILRHKYAEAGRLKRTLIVAPLILLRNWKNEFAMHSNIEPQEILNLEKAGPKRMLAIKDCVDNKLNRVILLNYECFSRAAWSIRHKLRPGLSLQGPRSLTKL